MSAAANDQYASLKLAKKRRKRLLTESQKILKPKYKINGVPVVTFVLPGSENLPHAPLSYATATNTLNID